MKKILLLFVKFYRKFISPLKPPCCKYYPTCSTYALTALEKHGALKGSVLAAWRLARCNPFSLGGVDHVPDEFFLYTLKSRKKREAKHEKSV
ncbi:MAG: membrane protein insertion efficiency factor YidD [Oscillospiraceae bacterium]|nr:membrane protein insertion efficiency factor YidD [Oscillospiraceae bacterium]